MSASDENILTITDPEKDRYASLRLIDWWNQDLIKNAHVMVVGAGALGNEVLKNLALLGVGHLLIVDFDTIEASNLARSVLYRPEDGGRSKAMVAVERVLSINQDIQVMAINGDITKNVGTGIYRRMDIVIGCLDNRAARLAVNSACWNVKKPWVDGALGVLDGLIRVFIPPYSACYECTLTEQDYALLNVRYSCPPNFMLVAGREPTLPTTASIIAAMQVQEALKVLHGQHVTSGQATYYSGETLRFRNMAYPVRENCPAHTFYESIVELPYCVADMTIRQFMDVVKSSLPGDIRGASVLLPQEVVTALYCPYCDVAEFLYRPFQQVIPQLLPCHNCGKRRIYDVISTLSMEGNQSDISLVQIGIPALHILPVRTVDTWNYVEFSKDEQYLLPGW